MDSKGRSGAGHPVKLLNRITAEDKSAFTFDDAMALVGGELVEA